jgi:putative membrane protein
MLAFWILVIVGIILVIRRFAVPPRDTPPLSGKQDTPLEILRRRYAAGEIDREQFEGMKKDLEK